MNLWKAYCQRKPGEKKKFNFIHWVKRNFKTTMKELMFKT